ncbi:HAD family hydrolase [Thermodesulfobacteriota bacterium]
MNSKKKKMAVIFDCDGVMFDSRNANINFYNHILAHFGLPPMAEDKIEFVHTHTADESVRYLFSDTPFLEHALNFRMQVDYAPFINDMVIEPGLKELLKGLKPRFGLAVATNRSNTIGKVLEYNGLDGIFDIVVSSLDVKIPKPDPESLIKIMDFFNIIPSESFYVGDSLVDYQTARAADVVFIAYKNRSLKADYFADSMIEIEDLIERHV